MGLKLSPLGESIVRKGGHDDQDDDGMLILELMKRAPGMSSPEYQQCFVDLRMAYGEDALYAIQTGHVQFEERPAGERTPEPKADKP